MTQTKEDFCLTGSAMLMQGDLMPLYIPPAPRDCTCHIDLSKSTVVPLTRISLPPWANWAKIIDDSTHDFIQSYNLYDELVKCLNVVSMIFGDKRKAKIRLIQQLEGYSWSYLAISVKPNNREEVNVTDYLIRCNTELVRTLSSDALPLLVLTVE